MIANIIIDIKSSEINFNYTYNIPNDMALSLGDRVLVPFGNMYRLGFVCEILKDTNKKRDYKLLDIALKLDNEPYLSSEFFSLFNKIKEMTITDSKRLLLSCIPKVLFIDYYNEVKVLNKKLLPEDLKGDFISKNKIRLPKTNINKIKRYQNLSKKGIVEFNKIYQDRLKSSSDIYYIPGDYDKSSLTKKELHFLENLKKETKISHKSLRKYKITKKEISLLLEKGYVKELEIRNNQKSKIELQNIVAKDFISKTFYQNDNFFIKTSKIKTHIDIIKDFYFFNKEDETIFLITGSANMADTYYKFLKNLNGVFLYHSYLSKKKLSNSLHNIINGNAKIVIGTKDALFLTAKKTSLIVLAFDNYHDAIFGDIYFDPYILASIKAKLNNVSIIYLGGYPSLNYYYKLDNKNKYIINEESYIPEIVLRKDDLKMGSRTYLGKTIEQKIRESIKNKDPIIIINTRKGESLYLKCADCYNVVLCPNCGHSMKKYLDKLTCPVCLTEDKIPKSCPICNSFNLKDIGFGAEKTKEELNLLFPHIKKVYLESPNYSETKKVMKNLNTGKISILLTTMGILKSGDIMPNTKVFLLNIDTDLKMPLYNSDEEIYNMIKTLQAKLESPLYIQTLNSSDFVIEGLSKSDDTFISDLLLKRELANLPPVYDNYNLIIKGDIGYLKIYQEAFIINKALQEKGYYTLGPKSADIYNLDGYNFSIIIKGKNLDPKKIKEIINEKKVDNISCYLYLKPIK